MNVKKDMPELMYERIQLCVMESNITKIDTAKKLGISKSTFFNYLNGVTAPEPITIVKMCKLFRVSSDWLLGITRDRG